MQTFKLHTEDKKFILVGGANNALQVESLEALLRLRQRLNAYMDNQTDDGPLSEAGRIATSDLIDSTQARALAIDLGYEPIPLQTLRSAIEAGHIPGARKRSRSGRAQTERGGRWEFPRQAFVEWLEERRGARRHDEVSQAQ
jgi:hypothetical protein